MIFLLILIFIPVYSYGIYPFFLWLISKQYPMLPYQIYLEEDIKPDVHILIPAHNEDTVINQKLHSIFNTQYPLEKINVYLGLDHCTDDTEKIILKFKEENPHLNIKIYSSKKRNGKPKMLNSLVEHFHIKDGIMILSDANVMFLPETIFELVRYFKDPQMGLVDARFKVSSEYYSHQWEGEYMSMEQKIKYREGLVMGAMQGPFGGCYAIRAGLFSPIPENFLVDDFFIAMYIMQSGFHSIVNPKAIVLENVHTNWAEEYRRKKRIAAGNFQNLLFFKHIFKKPFSTLSFCFFSHKVLRWIYPVLAPLLFIGSLAEWIWVWHFPMAFFVMITIITFAFLLFYILHKLNLRQKTIQRLTYFIYINIAMLEGFVNYLKGIKSNVWEPTKRS